MNLLPKASGTRPRVACEITPQGVVAARSAEAADPLSAVARVELAVGAVTPGLRPGNIIDRVAVTAAVRRVLESVGAKPNARGADITLVVPDAAVRVLLLDFDSLPNRLSEALPIVRFRLKKLLPFEPDDAMVTFQVMSTSKSVVRVLAVAIPRDVLSEYEAVAREAGFEPGAVVSSTLASLAAVDDESPSLLVNANSLGVTTAIVRSGILLLHRSVDLQEHTAGTPANFPPALFEDSDGMLPLVDVGDTADEWAAQEALPEHGRNPYADRALDEAAVQNEDGITDMAVPPTYAADAFVHKALEPAALSHSPYESPTLQADLSAESHNSILIAPTSMGTLTEDSSGTRLSAIVGEALHAHHAESHAPVAVVQPELLGEEIAQAVNVAAAYFEDTLAISPTVILSAGPLGAEKLGRILAAQGIADADGLRVRELVESKDLLADAVTAAVPRAWMSGVLGALRG